MAVQLRNAMQETTRKATRHVFDDRVRLSPGYDHTDTSFTTSPARARAELELRQLLVLADRRKRLSDSSGTVDDSSISATNAEIGAAVVEAVSPGSED